MVISISKQQTISFAGQVIIILSIVSVIGSDFAISQIASNIARFILNKNQWFSKLLLVACCIKHVSTTDTRYYLLRETLVWTIWGWPSVSKVSLKFWQLQFSNEKSTTFFHSCSKPVNVCWCRLVPTHIGVARGLFPPHF